MKLIKIYSGTIGSNNLPIVWFINRFTMQNIYYEYNAITIYDFVKTIEDFQKRGYKITFQKED